MKLYEYQQKELNETENLNRVAYFHEMGLGKTFTGGEKLYRLGAKMNLVICQKSKIQDWLDHFKQYYKALIAFDGTSRKELDEGLHYKGDDKKVVIVINYELAFRRSELLNLKEFTLMLDESSMIQNEQAKRSKFILKLKPKNVILLSGTPTSGKYEHLWSQIHLLGWNISKDLYWKQYIKTAIIQRQGFPLKIVTGYKNVDRLKRKLREHGARFLKSEEVFELPLQTFEKIRINPTKDYKTFKKSRVITVDGKELVGDTVLKKMLYERMLCGVYNHEKIQVLMDLMQSTDDRLIIFYNFNAELNMIIELCYKLEKPLSVINGKKKDLTAYDTAENSITAIQYQAGAMGLNLQKANKVIYFSPTLSSELFEQSKKRIHRIGQGKPCFYYELVCKMSIEEQIYKTLSMRKDYTEELFKEDEMKNDFTI